METGFVAIEKLVGLKCKMYSFLADNSVHKNIKGVKKNVVATISHNNYMNELLNNKCIRHSMNRIQSKGQRIRIYETSRISLSCFGGKMYLQNN